MRRDLHWRSRFLIHSKAAAGKGTKQAGFTLIELLDPNNPANIGWTGPITFTDQNGNGIIAILIGLLMPAQHPGGVNLQGIVVAQEGIGTLAGAPGTGQVTINWGDGLSGPFDASIRLKPFLRR